ELIAVVLGQEIEMLQERLHRGIKPVALPELQSEAFGEIPGEDAARLELLELGQGLLDQRQRTAQTVGELAEIAGDIAGGIEHVDDLQADDPFGRIGDVEMELFFEVLAQSLRAAG